MLKIGIKFEQEVIIEIGGQKVVLKVEKRSGGWCGLVFDAPKEVKIFRTAAKRQEFKAKQEIVIDQAAF